MWRVGADGTPLPPDTLVFDLAPGAPATIVDCCRVALLLRDALAGDGLTGCVKTSGKKGIQVYVPWERGHGTAEYARRLARTLEAEHPFVTSVMAKRARPGKVFIDWSQNNPAKTTIAPYSLRAGRLPTVSTPVRWAEVEACDSPDALTFTASDVLERVAEHGDLFQPGRA